MRRKLCLITALLFCAVAAFAQNKISGTVTDVNGAPVIGAAVMVEGSTTGAATDVDGKWELSVPKGTVLTVSSIGYTSQQFTVENKTVYDIVLEEDSEMLEQTVVVGYGTVKRTNFTGSVATYKVGDSPVSNMSKSNALEMLRGMAPGLSMSQSGRAGDTPSMQIRGQKSISGGSSPLIVLDGVIFKGSINDIDPNTVESMSVMKDATSLASYGSQAANGVIMITSKKGAIGKPTINFKGTLGLVEMNYKPDLHDPEGYIALVNARQGLPDGTTTWMSDLEKANYAAGKTTDWIDFSTQTGVVQDYSMNVSGGTEGMNYLFGIGYSDTENFIIGNNFIRENVSGRINTTITKYISAGFNFNWAATQNDGVSASYSRYYSPYGEPYMEDGSLRKYIIGPVQETATNPIFSTYVGEDRESRSNSATLGGNIEVKCPWIVGLSYRLTGNYTIRNSANKSFSHEEGQIQSTDVVINEATYDKYLSVAGGSMSDSQNISWVLDNIITYNIERGNHYFNGTLVYTRDFSKSTGFGVSGTGFDGLGNTTLGFWGLNNATTQKISSINYSLKTDIGYLARANYSFKNKYHFNASIRRDGSSVFGAKHKWGNFPAAGFAWTVSDEPFFKSAFSAVDYLKLKISWGKNGNQSLSPYGTLSRMAMGKSGGVVYYFDDQPAFGEAMSTLGNPNLGWETTTSWNGGWETDFLNRRIHWEVDVYKSKTTDQIFNRQIPVMGSGITNQSATMGRVDNFGIESSLRAQIVRKHDFNWTATATFTRNRNKLVELYGDGEDDIQNGLFLGESLGAIYGYKWIGIVQEDDLDYINANGAQPGDPMYANLDGSEDGRITATDREILGFNKEAFRASLMNTFTYKNWSLYVMLNGTFSSDRYGLANNDGAVRSTNDGVMMYLNTTNHPWWTKENRSNTYTRPYYSGSVGNYVPYGFVRLQDVNLSYSVPSKVLQKIGVAGLQFFASGKNLFFIAPKWEFSDPEVRSFTSAQLQRTYTFGLNLRF